MRQRWLSRRALLLHAALAVWFPGCLIAFWWQVHRAFSGNGLSYLYSVEWPVFAVTGVWAWWQLVHTDPETVGRRAQERLAATQAAARTTSLGGGAADGGTVSGLTFGGVAGGTDGSAATSEGSVGATNEAAAGSADGGEEAGATHQPVRHRDDEDPELAAYNDRLARLATQGPKTWRKR